MAIYVSVNQIGQLLGSVLFRLKREESGTTTVRV